MNQTKIAQINIKTDNNQILDKEKPDQLMFIFALILLNSLFNFILSNIKNQIVKNY